MFIFLLVLRMYSDVYICSKLAVPILIYKFMELMRSWFILNSSLKCISVHLLVLNEYTNVNVTALI